MEVGHVGVQLVFVGLFHAEAEGALLVGVFAAEAGEFG